MKNVEFLGVDIIFDGKIDRNLYDLGAVTLTCEDRSYIVDVIESVTDYDMGVTTISCKVAVDKETFDEETTKYDLEDTDLISPDLKGTLYLGSEYEVEPESMTLFVRIGGGMTKAIDLEID